MSAAFIAALLSTMRLYWGDHSIMLRCAEVLSIAHCEVGFALLRDLNVYW
jgi:hypothetical protein